MNADHPDTRLSEMPAFGETAILTRNQIRAVAAYVRSLSGAETDAAVRAEGEEIFTVTCAGCHGDDARGNPEMGAPNLSDTAWIYGGDDAALFATIHDGRMGWMPAWEGRLTAAEIKMLAVYLLDVLPEGR